MLKNINMSITWIDTIDSTNDEAKRQIQSLDHLSVISAINQTAGRGQRGNTWSSESGKNLTFSIIIKYGKDGYADLIPSKQFIISKIAAISVASFLCKYGITASIKWPNDIYVNDKKIAGILIEHTLHQDLLAYSIIGIGINVNQLTFDSNLYNPTSLLLESHIVREFDLNSLLEEFVNLFKEIIEQKPFSEIDSIYLSKLWRLNTKAKFIDYTALPGGFLNIPILPNLTNVPMSTQFCGIIRGVSDIGELIVENEESSNIRTFGFKEIVFII